MSRRWNRDSICQRLKVFQANVGRGGPAYDLVLQVVYQSHWHIVLFQGPWTRVVLGRRLTKIHPGYKTLIPVDDWALRLRVLTYIRRDVGYRISQPTSGLSRDLLQVVFQWLGHPAVTIWNVYNPPPGSANVDEAITTLLQQRPGLQTTVAGDFNLQHFDWDPVRGISHRGKDLAVWAA